MAIATLVPATCLINVRRVSGCSQIGISFDAPPPGSHGRLCRRSSMNRMESEERLAGFQIQTSAFDVGSLLFDLQAFVSELEQKRRRSTSNTEQPIKRR